MPEPKQKLAFVVDRFGSRYGGAEAYGVALMRELAYDFSITVFAREYDPTNGLNLSFVPLHVSPKWPSWVRSLIFAMWARRQTRTGFDIVHSHMNGWCGDVEVVHVTPVRYNWRVRPLPWLKRAMSRISLRVQTYLLLESRRLASRPAHRVVAVSTLIAKQLHEAYGDTLKPVVIPPGVSRSMTKDVTPAGIRRDLGWTPSDHVCLLVARNPLRKGLPTLLQALDSLPPAFKLLVVGGNRAVREYVARFGANRLAARVCIIDETPDVAQYYAVADSYIHPTLNDSFGMAPLEAMSFSLPVVLSPSPWCGFAQYVEHGTEALLLSDPENAAQIVQYVQQLASDERFRSRLVEGGHAVVSRHSWHQVAQQYRMIYNEIMTERRA